MRDGLLVWADDAGRARSMVALKIGASRAVLSVAAIGVLALGAAGCGSATPATPTTSVTAAATPSATNATETVAFGQPHRFRDGITVTLDAPRIYQRSQTDGSAPRGQLLQIHVTLVNGTTQAYAMTGPQAVDLVATVNEQPSGSQIVNDPAAVVAAAGTLLPGQTQSFDSLYALPPQPAELVITATDRAASPHAIAYRAQTPTVPTTTANVAPSAVPSTTPPPSTTRPRQTTTARPTTTTKAPVQKADSGPGCAGRAMAASKFNPSCPEYQGYLDPGGPGRGPTSGEIQHQYGCKAGYIPASEC